MCKKNWNYFAGVVFLVLVFGLIVPVSGQVVQDWVARYNGPANGNDVAISFVLDELNNAYVTGYSVGAGTGNDIATVKYDPAGNQLWEKRYDGPADADDYATAITLDGSGNIYVIGFSLALAGGYDYATLKYDADGNLLWDRRFNGPGNWNDVPNAISVGASVDDAGNIYVAGFVRGPGPQPQGDNYALLKYDTNGNLLWQQFYNGSGSINPTDHANALAVDASGIFVTGQANSDYTTVKYDEAGTLAWAASYNGPGNGYDDASAIAIAPGGEIVVTGTSPGVSTGNDYATLKYDANGTLLWTQRYNGPGSKDDLANAIAVDALGNVYVTGTSYAADGTYNSDFATLKYDPDGNLLWERRWSRIGSLEFDEATALTLDEYGNVYVTGYCQGGGIVYDYVTLKYNTNGDMVWEITYNGPASGTDWATAIALDNAGDVYVTGGSQGSGTGYDYATIKYDDLTQPEPGNEVDDYVIFATKRAIINVGAKVASGDIGVNASNNNQLDVEDEKELHGISKLLYCISDKLFADITIASQATTAGESDVKADKIYIWHKATVGGDVYYNKLKNKGTIKGDLITPLQLPLIDQMPDFHTGAAGNKKITVECKKTVTLAPGNYGDIRIKSKGKLILEGGIYNVNSIDADNGTAILFKGPAEVRVAKSLNTGQDSYIGPKQGTDIGASDIIFYVAGKGGNGWFSLFVKTVDIGSKNTILGNFYAPNGTLWIGNKSKATGAFFGKKVIAGSKTTIKLDSYFGNSGLGKAAIASAVDADQLPAEFQLMQNFPNPFNPETTIRYNVPAANYVSLVIYNIMGQQVRSLVESYQGAGFNSVTWDGTNNNGVRVASGTYIYRLKAGNFVDIKKMVVLQ